MGIAEDKGNRGSNPAKVLYSAQHFLWEKVGFCEKEKWAFYFSTSKFRFTR
jgi:hypothetical protein